MSSNSSYRRGGNISIQEISSSRLYSRKDAGPCKIQSKLPVVEDSAVCQLSKKLCSKGRTFQGFAYTFLGSFFISFNAVSVQKLKYMSFGELAVMPSVGALLGSIPIVIFMGINPKGPKSYRMLLIMRSTVGAVALYTYVLSFQHLPLAEAAIIQSAVPAIIMIIARVFLKESCGVVQSIAVLITLSGVLLSVNIPQLLGIASSQAPVTAQYPLGIASGLGCVLLTSFCYVVQRNMKDVHSSVIILYVGLTTLIMTSGITFLFGGYRFPLCGEGRIWFLMIPIFGFLGLFFFSLAIQIEAVGIVSVLRVSFEIVLAMVMQMIFFGSTPNTFSICGGVLVLISISIIGIGKWLQGKSEYSRTRKALRIFLL